MPSGVIAYHSVSIHAPWEGCDFRGIRPSEMRRVSIHAPWEGCDGSPSAIRFTMAEFQFTHPGKGATNLVRRSTIPLRFQFTHPGKGATRGDIPFISISLVSIHAPWEGCDLHRGKYLLRVARGFNSRTLGRVRLY